MEIALKYYRIRYKCMKNNSNSVCTKNISYKSLGYGYTEIVLELHYEILVFTILPM